jgi:hypothetical protein
MLLVFIHILLQASEKKPSYRKPPENCERKSERDLRFEI